ncbi:MAG TPA: TIR domain-containing protein [Bryobacteraceae bacterium]|nr:TIR domain-containing protein [Bryobacteraceae bacterium]
MRQCRRNKRLLDLVGRCLQEGSAIEIDGVGRFRLDEQRQIHFEPNGRPRVFLAYAEEDRSRVRDIYDALHAADFEPWMDERSLLPGQNWPRSIEHAIEATDFFLACFSRRSSSKRGYFQSELRFALDLANKVPLDDIFLVPVRLEVCAVPRHIARKTQYVDLFPDWNQGMDQLVRTMREQERQRREQLS